MTLPTKILLTAFVVLGVQAHADLTASDEGAANFEAAAKSAGDKPAETSTEAVLKAEVADADLEASNCSQCHTATSQSKSQLHHTSAGNFNDLKALAEFGRNSAKSP